MNAATRSERMTSKYVLTLDFKLGRERHYGAQRHIRAESDVDAVKQAHALIKEEARERRGGWVPIPDSARLVSVVQITEQVAL